MFLRLVQPENARDLIFVRLRGSSIEVNPVQFSKARGLISIRFWGKFKFAKLQQFLKATASILWIELGKVTELNDVHPKNIPSGKIVHPVGIVTELKEVQF